MQPHFDSIANDVPGSDQSLYLTLFETVGRGQRPCCSVPGCLHNALEIDPFYPYLDDSNRCAQHLKNKAR